MSYSERNDFDEKLRILGDIEHWIGEVLRPVRPLSALEIGGAGGMLAGLVANRFGKVLCTDVVDWNSAYNGEFPRLLSEKFARNGHPFALDRVQFLQADAQDMDLRDDRYDLVFSLNAFEHIPDPVRALREAVRVTKPEGMIYLSFDPVWTADSGSHFLHRLNEPWSHLTLGDQEIARVMRENGADEGEIEAYRTHMNRLPASFYRDTFAHVLEEAGASIVWENHWSGFSSPDYETHPNRELAAAHLNMAVEDLAIRGFTYVARKR